MIRTTSLEPNETRCHFHEAKKKRLVVDTIAKITIRSKQNKKKPKDSKWQAETLTDLVCLFGSRTDCWIQVATPKKHTHTQNLMLLQVVYVSVPGLLEHMYILCTHRPMAHSSAGPKPFMRVIHFWWSPVMV